MDKKPYDNRLGDSGSALEGIRDMVLTPEAWDILPYYHNYTPDGRYILTSMFIPAYRCVLSLMDKRGWCDPEKGKEYFEQKRLDKAKDPKALLMYKAEYCFTIEEALSQQGDNIFPKEELAEQQAAITIYKNTPIPVRGNLSWKIIDGEITKDVKWTPNPEGKIQIIEHPMLTSEGSDYKNLYVGGIDSIDIGTSDSSTDKNVSDFCIVIKKRTYGLAEPMYVAIYKDRPRDVREAYAIAAKLLAYYNCQAVLESTRTAIITYFRDHGYIYMLMKRPRATLPDVTKGNSSMIGAPATIKTITHYRELLYDFCIDYSKTIYFPEMVDQLLRYSDDKKKEFDIVAALGMTELGDEEMSYKKPEPRESKEAQFEDYGWWTDGKGYKHYGIIPKTQEERDGHSRIRREDSWLYQDNI